MISLIWAQDRNGAIGKNGTLPWHVPEDFAFFKRMTMGLPLLMGRTTWESMPQTSRPLEGRLNLILTHHADYNAPGATLVSSVEDALEYANPDMMVSGGRTVFDAIMPFADALYVTQLDLDVQNATRFAPPIDPDWHLVQASPEQGWASSKNGTRYRFLAYEHEGSHIGPRPLQRGL
ncbi:MAG: dihydrofolate reductase [Actinomycetaceae bacterium]|nr:dihydrofolate reductase [Actinomycetaceae bacterium]MDY6083627.1 dihydrofolate reductase [Actinomycetaceae bacterium]